MNMRKARRQLGLSVNAFAALHKVKPHTVRRWELDPKYVSHRTPGGSAIALTEHLLTEHLRKYDAK